MPQPGTDHALEVTRLGTRQQLVELEAEWERLLQRTDVASPFLTPGWQLAWLDTYGVRHQPYVLVARHRGELLGLWPLARRRRGPFTVLEPIGAGRSDWLDVPTVREQRQAVLSAFVEYLEEHKREWDLLELRDVLSESPSIPLLAGCTGLGRVRLERRQRTVAPFLPIAGTWEQFLASKRSKFKSNIKYYRRLPEREGKRLDIYRVQDWDAEAAVEVLAVIERRSWKAKTGNLKVSTPVGKEFYRRFCDYFAARDALDLWRADLDGVPAAFVLNIVYGGKCYHYNTCYDEASGYISPGLLLHSEAISLAFERGLREYDFLSGDEPYKERWCSAHRTIDHLALFHTSPVSRAAYATLVELKWTLRRSQTLKHARQRVLSVVRQVRRRLPGAQSLRAGASAAPASGS